MREDYSKFLALADRLIPKYGRQVRIFNTTRDPQDSAKPWNGPQQWDDATATPEEVVTVEALFIGELLALTRGQVTGQQRSIVPTVLTELTGDIFLVSGSCPQDLQGFDKLLDAEMPWNIKRVVTIKPGNVPVLYALQVER